MTIQEWAREANSLLSIIPVNRDIDWERDRIELLQDYPEGESGKSDTVRKKMDIELYKDGSDSNGNIVLRIPYEEYKHILARAAELDKEGKK